MSLLASRSPVPTRFLLPTAVVVIVVGCLAAPVSAQTVPGAPTEVTAKPGNGSLTLNWKAPASDGGRRSLRCPRWIHSASTSRPTQSSKLRAANSGLPELALEGLGEGGQAWLAQLVVDAHQRVVARGPGATSASARAGC